MQWSWGIAPFGCPSWLGDYVFDQIWTYVLFPKVYLEYQFCWTKNEYYIFPHKNKYFCTQKIWIPNLLLKNMLDIFFLSNNMLDISFLFKKNIMDIRFFVEETMYKIRLLFKNYCFFPKKLEYQMAYQKIILNILFFAKKQLWISFFCQENNFEYYYFFSEIHIGYQIFCF